MNVARILPELQASLMCESVHQETNGNLILVGVVNLIRVPQLPVTTGRFCVYNRWTAGMGRFHTSTRFVAPDGVTTLSEGGTQFELRDPAHHASNVLVFGNVELKTAGTYYLEVLVDSVMRLRSPLSVILAAPATQPANPAMESKQA